MRVHWGSTLGSPYFGKLPYFLLLFFVPDMFNQFKYTTKIGKTSGLEACWFKGSRYVGVSQNWGTLLGGLYNKDYTYNILGSPYIGKLPYVVLLVHTDFLGADTH